jgi:transcriptional regulator with XRE-family HTH domain
MPNEGWKPLEDWERPYVKRLGNLLFELRSKPCDGDRNHLTQRELARRAGMSSKGLEKIEQGVRRTRRATLERIAGALVEARPAVGTVESVLEQLLKAAGPALAPPSAWSAAHLRQAERRERRRAKRMASAEFLERHRAQCAAPTRHEVAAKATNGLGGGHLGQIANRFQKSGGG